MQSILTSLSAGAFTLPAGTVAIAKIVFWAAMVWLALIVFARSFGRGQPKTVTRAYRVFFFVLALLFVGVLAYQATWQLAGFARPSFVEFMQRYNRRPDNPAARMMRGTIRDVSGAPLAEDRADEPGRRFYPAGAAVAHIVGYRHPVYGLTGVESAEHAALSGITRGTDLERERFRQNILRRDALRGHDVELTLHRALQDEAHALMKNRKGAVVMLDPSSGAILCLYSAPGFDPNDLRPDLFERRDKEARLLNRALQGLYPAGSTFKVLIAAAALEAGINPRYDCPGDGVRFGTGNRPIRDHEYYAYERKGRAWPGHGTINMREAMAKSSNIYFARLGVDLGGPAVYDAVVRAGMTRGFTLLEGSSGKITASPGKFPVLGAGDKAKTAQISIGQGEMLVTPLHMAVLAAAIGRQGALWAPRLLASAQPQPLDPVISGASARALAGIMRYAVQHGSGSGADVPGLQVAGKTGTAQNPHGADHSWFIGFAPATDARVAFAVLVENGGFGSTAAVPVAAGLLKRARALGLVGASLPAEGKP